MVVEIGKFLRKLRIDQEERLLDMAGKLKKSSAFLSAVERGRKEPPSGFEELVTKAYQLGADKKKELANAVDRSRKAFTIKPDSAVAHDTAAMMARKIGSLSVDDLKKIQKILNQEDEHDDGTGL